MEADRIIDHEEKAVIDSVYNTNSHTKSTNKTITFYFVKHHRYDDPEITRKMEMAHLEVKKKKEDIEQYYNDLQCCREEERITKRELENCAYSCKYYTSLIHQQREDLFHLQNALDTKSTVSRVAMQSPEVIELTKHIKGLKHRVQGNRLTVKEENQLIKQLRELNGERDELVALVSSNDRDKQDYIVEKYEDYMYNYNKIPRKKWLQPQAEEIDELKAIQRYFRKNMRCLKHSLKEIDNNITCLVQKIDKATSEREMANKLRRKLKNLTDNQNACYHENQGLINSARQLAAKKDIIALAEHFNTEKNSFCNGVAMKPSETTTIEGYFGRLTVVGSVKMDGQETLMKVPLYKEVRFHVPHLRSNKDFTESSKEIRGTSLLKLLCTPKRGSPGYTANVKKKIGKGKSS